MKTMEDYTCYCTEEQTKRAIKLDAKLNTMGRCFYAQHGGNVFDDGETLYIIPTTQQMIGWLRELNMHIFNPTIQVFNVCVTNKGCIKTMNNELAAIDAALDYLENNHSL